MIVPLTAFAMGFLDGTGMKGSVRVVERPHILTKALGPLSVWKGIPWLVANDFSQKHESLETRDQLIT